MRYRNFSMDEAAKLNYHVADKTALIQNMPLGKRVKSVTCEVDDNIDTTEGFPEIRVHVNGKLTDSQLNILCSVAYEFPEERVIDSTCSERMGVRATYVLKIKSAIITFRWIGLRKIDSVCPTDYFFSDGTFSSSYTKDKVAVGVVYYVDEKEVRIVSLQQSGKLPWANEPPFKLTEQSPDINPFGIFEADQPLEDLSTASEKLISAVNRSGKKLSSFPALEFAAESRSAFFKKGEWHLPLAGDAVYLFSRSQRAELSRRLRQLGGKGLCHSCWLGVEYTETKAYIVQLTTANSMIKSVPKTDTNAVFLVARLDWKRLETM